MNRERAREMLPVIQAYAQGKAIQVSLKDCLCRWEDYNGSTPDFSNPNIQWRIKPEPRDGWIPSYAVCASPDAAAVLARSMIGTHLAQTAEVIHVREVLE